jgi:hypothetical protein
MMLDGSAVFVLEGMSAAGKTDVRSRLARSSGPESEPALDRLLPSYVRGKERLSGLARFVL